MDDIPIDPSILELLILSDSAISKVLNLIADLNLSSSIKDTVNHVLLNLRFFNLFVQYWAKLDELKEINTRYLIDQSNVLYMKDTLGGAIKGLQDTNIKALQAQDCQAWVSLASELLEKVQLCKPKIDQDLDLSVLFLNNKRRFEYKFSSFELQKFYNCLLDSLNDLARLKVNTVSDLDVEIQDMKERVQLLMQIHEFNRYMDSNNEDVKCFNLVIQTWLCSAACLSLMYWTGEKAISEKDRVLILSTPRIISMFLTALKRLWSSSLNQQLMQESILKFADFFLGVMEMYPFKDDIEALNSGVIFLTTFLVVPPMTEDSESVRKQEESLNCDEPKGSVAEKSTNLDNTLLEKKNKVRAEIRKLYAGIFLDFSLFNFPSTNLLGFLDSLLDSLKETSGHSRDREAVILQKELQTLRPFLGTVLEMQNDNLEIKDLWPRIVNVVHRSKIGIELLLYMNSLDWYDVKCLSDVTDEIKLLKCEISKFQDQRIPNDKLLIPEKHATLAPAVVLEIDDEFVGFEDESETILNHLIEGSSTLNIVSVFGMAGQGKTTLAKKIYNNRSVRSHFDKRAWCCVSQIYQTKMLFLEILGNIVPNKDFSSKTEEELEQLLRQTLLGQRYFVVIDDIWDIGAWNALRCSFPDQSNGSRIMFTSRNKDVALQAGHDCILHPLRQLSSQESLGLLKKKLFITEDFPLHLMDVAKRIANSCNGLPLALVVIAGILSEKRDDLKWWNNIAESIRSQAHDGCMDILELSYKHLPEHLKPCFLYFGAFPEDSQIRVRRLIQLWISEGFIQKSREGNMEDAANKYLMDLVGRSLVVVAQKSSKGGIKACRVHDLLHTFCQEKGRKENFLQVRIWGERSRNSTVEVFKDYRISFQSKENYGEWFFDPCLHSLLLFLGSDDYYSWFHNGNFFCICNFKLLHVLDMEDVYLNGYFREEMVLLVHLRYLAIKTVKGVFSIPPSIASIRNLETFRMVSSTSRLKVDKIFFPNSIWTMKRLRHIDVGEFTVSFSNDYESQEFYRLDNIIQTFSAPFFHYGEATDKLLTRIPNVRKLRCIFGGPRSSRCNNFHSLEFLSQLESLTISLRFSRFRCLPAFRFPSTLKKLTLNNFYLSRSQIATIGQLHELEVLKLLFCRFEEKTWELQDDEFPKLKFLKLVALMNIAEWDIAGDFPFPRLEQLIMDDCDELEISHLFLELVTTLKKIELLVNSAEILNSARRLREEFEHINFRVESRNR